MSFSHFLAPASMKKGRVFTVCKLLKNWIVNFCSHYCLLPVLVIIMW